MRWLHYAYIMKKNIVDNEDISEFKKGAFIRNSLTGDASIYFQSLESRTLSIKQIWIKLSEKYSNHVSRERELKLETSSGSIVKS